MVVDPDSHANENFGLYSLFWISSLSDSPLGMRPIRLLRQFYRRLIQDYSTVAKEYATLFDVVTANLDENDLLVLTQENFERLKHTPIAAEIISMTRHFDPLVTQFVLSFLSFGKRSPSDNPDALQAIAFHKWQAVEDRLAALKLPDWVDDLKLIIDKCVAPHYHHIPLPSHGPGKVADRGVSSNSDKHKVIMQDSYPLKTLSKFGRGVDIARIVPETSTSSGALHCLKKSTALLSFVDKNVQTLRSICQEPAQFMYSQKSVERALRQAIDNGPFRRFSHLEDQGYNRLAAQYGSIYRNTDTIDLSDASDSVSLDLVRAIFSGDLYYDLLGTRSSHVQLPDGRIIKVKKFAPMGSSTCFPTQCIVFASCIILAYHWLLHGRVKLSPAHIREILWLIDDDPGSTDVTGLRATRVYGDDIIIDSRATSFLVEILTLLGFRVNTGKSFMGKHPFRESCGGYYQSGYIVKPVSLKSNFTDPRRSLGAKLYSLVELANRSYYAGYTTVAAVAEVLAKTWHLQPGESIRCIYPGPGGLNYYGRYVSDSHVFFPIMSRKRIYGKYSSKAGRFNAFYRDAFSGLEEELGIPSSVSLPYGTTCEELQRDEGAFLSLKAIVEADERDNVYAFIQWMRHPNRCGGSPTPEVQSDPELNLREAWKPL